jgi:hypothetical protein
VCVIDLAVRAGRDAGGIVTRKSGIVESIAAGVAEGGIGIEEVFGPEYQVIVRLTEGAGTED